MNNIVRIIEWVQPGYEGTFTQYVITPDADGDYGRLDVCQVATKDNMGRAMNKSPHSYGGHGSIEHLRKKVDLLIGDRVAFGCKELD